MKRLLISVCGCIAGLMLTWTSLYVLSLLSCIQN